MRNVRNPLLSTLKLTDAIVASRMAGEVRVLSAKISSSEKKVKGLKITITKLLAFLGVKPLFVCT